MNYLSKGIAALTLFIPATAISQSDTPKEIRLEASEEIRQQWREAASDAIADIILLNSKEGQKLLAEANDPDYEPLAANRVPQLKSHCGAASAVAVQNTLLPDGQFTQMNLFTPETTHIITQDIVYRIGFTLEELDNMIEIRSGLKTTRFHAGKKESQYGPKAWLTALKENKSSPDNQLIINYPVRYIIDRQNKGGHFSPIAAYHEEKNMVLILEVSDRRESFWIDAGEIWEAMTQVDSVSGMERGWILVKQPDATEQETLEAKADGN